MSRIIETREYISLVTAIDLWATGRVSVGNTCAATGPFREGAEREKQVAFDARFLQHASSRIVDYQDAVERINAATKQISGTQAPEQISKQSLYEFWQLVCQEMYKLDTHEEDTTKELTP